MKTTTLFIIALIAITNAQFMRKNNQQDVSVLSELDQNHFGSSILSAISVHLSAQTPMETISKLLADVTAGLKKDQADHDTLHANTQAKCAQEIEAFESAIKHHTAELESAQKEKEANEKLLQTAENQLAATKNDISTNEQRQADGKATREANHKSYKAKIAEHEDAVKACDEATVLVESLRSGSSFIQIKGMFEQVTQKMIQHQAKHALYTPIITAMAQLATKADQSTVNKILGLIARLRAALVESQATEQATEDEQVKNWNELSATLQQEHAQLMTRKSNLERDINTYNGIIENAKERIKTNTAALASNKAQLAAKRLWCKAQAKFYETQTAERTRELEIMDRLTAHFNEKIASMKQYLKDRVDREF